MTRISLIVGALLILPYAALGQMTSGLALNPDCPLQQNRANAILPDAPIDFSIMKKEAVVRSGCDEHFYNNGGSPRIEKLPLPKQ
jgi:hypothetical protein